VKSLARKAFDRIGRYVVLYTSIIYGALSALLI
jgi:hypothetical protein